jgi:hypothetical protein
MKKVVLYDIDSKIPNLALMKVSRYYKQLGYHVTLSKEIKYIRADKYFASSVFHNEKSMKCTQRLIDIYGIDIDIGGSGYDLKKKLSAEIDGCFPDYDLYNHRKFALGFLTRGCNKKCPFCLVPQKEGKIDSYYASFDDFVPKSQKYVLLLDNNLLASECSYEILEEITRRDYTVNFSQSIDISYLNKHTFPMLMKIKSMNSRFTRQMIYFSCNTTKQAQIFLEKEQFIKAFGKNAVTVIIMFGYNTKLSEDYEILSITRKLGMIPFVQEYVPIPGIPAKIPTNYFDLNLDIVASYTFRTNGQNGEKFLRFVNKLYFSKYNRYYLPILKAIYKYNNKNGINKYLQQPHLLTGIQY